MPNSDTESDIECFESAEESLGESEEEKEQNLKIKSLSENESEAKLVTDSSSVDSTREENVSSKSLLYRKRPERLKRLPSDSPPSKNRGSRKSSGNDFIVKTEKIDPENFFQDITSNLSKNINRSLNTLQQTSSNVKDLILNSLPVVSVDEKERFSYDDEQAKITSADDTIEKSVRSNIIDSYDAERMSMSMPFKSTDQNQCSVKSEENNIIDEKTIFEKNYKGSEEENNKQQNENFVDFNVESNEEGNIKLKKHLLKEECKNDEMCNKNISSNVSKGNQKLEFADSQIKFSKESSGKTEKLKILKDQCDKDYKNQEEIVKVRSVEKGNKKTQMEENQSDCSNVNKEKAGINDGNNSAADKPESSEHIDELSKVCNTETKQLDILKDADSEKNVKGEICNTLNFSALSNSNHKIISSQNLFETEYQEIQPQEVPELSSKNFPLPFKEVILENAESLKKNSFCVSERKANPDNPTEVVDDVKKVIKSKSNSDGTDNSEIQKHLTTSLLQQNKVNDESVNNINFPEDDVSLLEKSKNNLNGMEVKHNLVESKCNIEELKTVLKNLVQEDVKGDNKKEHIMEGFNPNQVESVEESGWEDFDFSDDEVQFSNEKIGKDNEKDSQESNLNKSKVQSSEARQESKTDYLNLKGKVTPNIQEVEKTEKKEKEVEIKDNSLSDDGWDWDGWEDDTENKEETKTEKMKPEEEKVERWSGWDNFGKKQEPENWGLTSWGVDMLLNKATAVTQGLSSVLEAGLGAPDPETLARMEKLEREKSRKEDQKRTEKEEKSSAEVPKKSSLTEVNLTSVFGIGSLVAGVTSKIVEHSKIQDIGSKVISGGLDTLETLGKKTMEVLQENDPGLRNKMWGNKVLLSQVLKDAKEKADKELKKVEEKELARKCHFEIILDDFQGMVHLEALEMLSKQCELKLEQIRSSMSPEDQEEFNGTMEGVETLCELDDWDVNLSDTDDFKIVLSSAVEPLANEISLHQIFQIHDHIEKWLEASLNDPSMSASVVHQKAVSTVAELTAAAAHQFHKVGELLAVKECRKTIEEIESLSKMTNFICLEISKLCFRFVKILQYKLSNDAESLRSVTEKIEAVQKNAISFVKMAYCWLVPVVQIGAAV